MNHLFPYFLINRDEYVDAIDYWEEAIDGACHRYSYRSLLDHPTYTGDPIIWYYFPRVDKIIQIHQGNPVANRVVICTDFHVTYVRDCHKPAHTLSIYLEMSEEPVNIVTEVLLPAWIIEDYSMDQVEDIITLIENCYK